MMGIIDSQTSKVYNLTTGHIAKLLASDLSVEVSRISLVFVGNEVKPDELMITNIEVKIAPPPTSAPVLSSHLSLLEDSVIIYRIVRAPERRVFFVDVGNMPPQRVKAYLESIKNEQYGDH